MSQNSGDQVSRSGDLRVLGEFLLRPGMLDRKKHVLLVELLVAVSLQLEQKSGRKTAAVAASRAIGSLRLHFLQARSGNALGLGQGGEFARIVVDLQSPPVVGAGFPLKGQVRAQVVVVPQGDGVRARLVSVVVFIHMFLVLDFSRGFVKRDLGFALHGFVAGGIVGHDHRVVASAAARVVFVLEKEIDPLFLHEARDEVVIRLAVLNAVFADRIGAAQQGRVQVIGRYSGFLDHLRDDLGHVFVLKNTAVEALSEQPERRRQVGVEHRVAAYFGDPPEARELAAEPAGFGTVLDRQHGRLANHVLGLDLVALGLEVNLKAEQLRQTFRAFEVRNAQFCLQSGDFKVKIGCGVLHDRVPFCKLCGY